MDRSALLDQVVRLARSAGAAIMEVYATAFEVRDKADASPVTAADERAESIILAGLRQIEPQTPVVAEEQVAAGRVPQVGDRFWLVDPLDGTREFVSRNGEFTVNIALIEHQRPVLGVVYAPALDRLYAGAEALGAFVEQDGVRRDIRCRSCPSAGFTVVASRSHNDEAALDRFLADRRVASVSSAGSSLKLALIAAGEADLYPRLGRTMEWDIAAGHAIVNAAGGRVTSVDGSELRYGKPGFENPHFVAVGMS
ncbi:MAG TPA: 3'(2'),5'-bisphosphate nucleotidase CysQ [Casimicrobiaceae bacterium]|nr:3'(2'),5'-bisphosphate nucleotidase CysQ [Casimicrobiaceae bacterium]